MNLNVRKPLNTCAAVTCFLVITACSVTDSPDAAAVPAQSTSVPGGLKVMPPSIHTPTVLHYEPGPDGVGGSWYLHWPGTFGVARIRLPISLHPGRSSHPGSPAQPDRSLVAQLIRRPGSTDP